MNKTRILTTVAISIGLLGSVGLVIGDDDFRRSLGGHDVAPADFAPYQEECGGCHMTYPPGLLPADAWQRVFDNLDNHYGDNAELPSQQAELIRGYVLQHAADSGGSMRTRSFAAQAFPATEEVRISGTDYFKRKHHELPARMVTGNPEVGSFSNCQACHTQAEQGSFNEHQVHIPGHGRWDD